MSKSPGWQIVDRVKAGELLVFDGGYGTALFDAGLLNGACPEVWNDTHADVVRGIHKGYFDAGSDSSRPTPSGVPASSSTSTASATAPAS